MLDHFSQGLDSGDPSPSVFFHVFGCPSQCLHLFIWFCSCWMSVNESILLARVQRIYPSGSVVLNLDEGKQRRPRWKWFADHLRWKMYANKEKWY